MHWPSEAMLELGASQHPPLPVVEHGLRSAWSTATDLLRAPVRRVPIFLVGDIA
jgi:hypothetical protein